MDNHTDKIIDKAMEDYKKVLKEALVQILENHYGGPAKWPTGVYCNEDDEDALVDVWNAAIEVAVEEVKKI